MSNKRTVTRTVFTLATVFAGVAALAAAPTWAIKEPAIVELTPNVPPEGSASTAVEPAASARSVAVVDVSAIQAEMQRHRGRPLILHFWASWCGPCLVELPLVNQFAQQLRDSGAELLSISLDNPDERQEHVLSVLREKAPRLTAAIARVDDPDRFITAFRGIRGQPWEGSIPALFAFDKKGLLTRQHLGEATAQDLAALARGAGVKPSRPAARTPRARASSGKHGHRR